jgi:hypothetical protein
VKRIAPPRLGMLAVAVTLLVAACDGQTVTEPELAAPDAPLMSFTFVAGEVCLHKTGPTGSSASFTIVADPEQGEFPLGQAFTVDAMGWGECTVIWGAGSSTGPVNLTIAEVPQAGTTVQYIAIMTDSDATWRTILSYPDPASITIQADAETGWLVKFGNIADDTPPPPPPPPPGAEGCTPGYWRQAQHFANWPAPYTPTASFHEAFGVNAFPGRTLRDVVNLSGGGLNALGRHAVAALLNAESGQVDYGLSVADVIAQFQAAYGSGDYEATKDAFAALNEAGCPL